jgi:hypothetical protein
MRNKLLGVLCFIILALATYAQDLGYVRRVTDSLCSNRMSGRGYLKDGSKHAAEFIKAEFRKVGLQSFTQDYVQDYGFPVVTFPGKLTFSIDNIELEAGVDYIPGAGCSKLSGVFDLVYVDSATVDNNMLFEKFEKTAFFKSMLVIDGLKEARLKNKDRMVKILKNQYKARGIIYTKQKKLTWSVATEWDAFPVFYVLDDKIKSFSKRIKIDISPDLKQHIAENLVGFIKGKTQPDSFVVFSAHYDHLGMLGPDAIFRGANDNASGVAMMLDIMQYYTTFPPAYSVAFIAFSGEEAGLFGSYYYTQNPLFPLNQISLLINLDLMGTGDEGMTVVNGEIFKEDFLDLTLINLENNYLPDIKARGKAPNSDHYYFSENGVRAFFFYLMGKYNYYHDVGDVPDELTFSRYNEAFKLITSFASYKMTPKL